MMPTNEDTMRYHRSGSAILLCLALAAIAVMIGFAFLRVISRQDVSGTSEMLDGLARDAARSGLAHATEQIMADYNGTSLKLAVGSAGAVPTSTMISPVPTHLDVATSRRLRRRRTVLGRAVIGLEALVRRPRLQQGPIDREVLARDVAAELRLADHRGEELVRHVMVQQPAAVLRKR